jgi:hypothetical protein
MNFPTFDFDDHSTAFLVANVGSTQFGHSKGEPPATHVTFVPGALVGPVASLTALKQNICPNKSMQEFH